MFFSSIALADSVQVATNTDALHALSGAGFVVKLTLLILIAMSVASWAIIVRKRKQFNALDVANPPFEDKFWKANSLEEVFEHLKDFPDSNMAVVFRLGYLELKKIAESGLASMPKGAEVPLLTGIDNLQRAINKAIDIEVARLESRLIFLANVGSNAPFIGLFGTVWGIMSSFSKIGASGSASLAVVAPGIAEALIATGVGLATAIPATAAYNFFVSKIKKQELELNNFAADFLNLTKRNFFRGQ
jgi:biopolymer transport protein TolQ